MATPTTFDEADSNVPLASSQRVSPTLEAPTHVALTRDQVDVCRRLHRRIRIRIRINAIQRLLEPEIARDELIEIILDLIGEIPPEPRRP